MSLVDLELAPAAKSYFSINRLLNPLVEASSKTPVPLHPPPTTTISYSGLVSTYDKWSCLDLNLGNSYFFTGASILLAYLHWY